MIQHLTITNFALIDKVRVEFSPGLNVLTGETGAGKSILIGALGLVLGSKVESEVIRTGTEEASVTASLDAPRTEELLSWLEENGLTWPNDEALVLQRAIRHQKRSVSLASGQAVSRAQLEQLTGFLVDLHGQHEHQSLFSPDRHRKLLDQYAGLQSDLLEFGVRFQALSQAKKDWESLVSSETEREQDMFRLTQIVTEIEKVGTRPGEEDELKAERQRLDQHGKLTDSLLQLEQSLSDGRHGAISQVRFARQALGTIATIDERWGPEEQRLENALIEIEDICDTLHRYRLGLSFQPERLEEVNDRLAQVHAVDRKFGPGWESLHQTLSESRASLSLLENFASDR